MPYRAGLSRSGGFAAICLLAGWSLWGMDGERKGEGATAAPVYRPISHPGQDAAEVLRVEPISEELREKYGLDPSTLRSRWGGTP